MYVAPPDNNSSFFFNDTATTEIYTLSLHAALPIFDAGASFTYTLTVTNLGPSRATGIGVSDQPVGATATGVGRKSTRLNSSHSQVPYAATCSAKYIANEATATIRLSVTAPNSGPSL